MSAARIPARRWYLDIGASLVLLAVPVAGFWPTYASGGYLVAAVGGLLAGTAIAAVAAWRRWGILVLAGLTVLAYFVLGPALAVPDSAIARVVPTLESWRLLAVGAIDSWKQLLTTVAPVPAGEGFLIVPFLLSLVSTVLTVSLALRARTAAWALLPATAFLAAQIALGTSDPALPVVEGIVFAVAAIGWLAIRQAWAPQGDAVSLGEGGASTGRTRRLALGSGVVAVAVVLGVVVSGFAAPAAPRYVLRDIVIPPFDVREYASPLQSFRSLVRDSRDETLFTVSGMPEGARVRMAAMDAYSGTVYNVSDTGAGSSSAFTPVRGEMSPGASGTPAKVHVEIAALSSVWMPGVGAVQDVTFDGDRADALRRSAYYNAGTGTGVVASKLKTGDAYDLHVVVPSVPTDDALADAEFAPVKIPAQKGVPEGIAEMASDAAAEATTPVEQVRALQAMLSTTGFFSHGLEGEPQSRAGHGAERIASMLGAEQMIGDDEQYAVAMALLADSIGIPSRVVLGFYPDPEAAPQPVFDATGENVHAWVEVAFDGFGWVPFDPTPPEDQIPSDQTTKPKADPKPQVLQPPPPQEEPVDLPPTIPDEREDDGEDSSEAANVALIVGIAAASLGTLLVLAAPFVVVGALKATRRRRRRAAERPSDRISGGWDELVDRASDLGTPVRPGATRLEDAAVVGTAFAEPAVATLALRADAEVFGPAEPTDADIAEFWRQVDEMVGTMSSRSSFWRRIGARLSLRSLLAETRFALPAKTPRDPKRARTPKPAASSSSDNPEKA